MDADDVDVNAGPVTVYMDAVFLPAMAAWAHRLGCELQEVPQVTDAFALVPHGMVLTVDLAEKQYVQDVAYPKAPCTTCGDVGADDR